MLERVVFLLFLCALAEGCAGTRVSPPPSDAPAVPAGGRPEAMVEPREPETVSFDLQVRPILEARCSPCHFEGGKMYEQLPFDREETILGHGPGVLLRIKDEPDHGTIRSFLDREGAAAPSTP